MLPVHKGDLTVIDCKECGFYHLDPLPNKSALKAFYQREFWQKTKIGTRERMNDQIEWWTAIYTDWLWMVRGYNPSVRTLLDVGAGYGHFISNACRLGMDAVGIEPSEDVDYPAIWRGEWEKYQFGNRFDCISALWLIEHLPDPMAFLKWVRERLNDNGVLLAVVPNDFSDDQFTAVEVGKALPYYWIDPTHLNYFTWSSFSNLLGRAGFRIVERSTLYPMERFLMDGFDYTRDPELGAELHAGVRKCDLSETAEQRAQFYQNLAEAGTGREIVVVAVKE